jgi:flavin reductase (DIM6/NTAB) family NADH-FMN oxidoreductase RutF
VHSVIDPAILYFGTPVVLVSSTNPDGSPNVAPMSSAWWLGRSCLLGFGARSHTPANIRRTGECVLNLPSVDQVAAVNRLARTTGSLPVPPHKVAMGYRHERDKLAVAGLTPLAADVVAPPRIAECRSISRRCWRRRTRWQSTTLRDAGIWWRWKFASCASTSMLQCGWPATKIALTPSAGGP